MRILVDTQIFLWAITGDPRMSKAHRAHYLDPANDLYLSVASVWEILIKAALGRLAIPAPRVDFVVRQMSLNRLSSLPIRLPHLADLETLPGVHRDPFDRIIVAQARAEGMAILTSDRLFKKHAVRVL
jgi:PIN domain nuclease of toxin-antitoxin system